MGKSLSVTAFSHEDRRRYREKVQQCLDALAAMLATDKFSATDHRIGLEIEMNLVDKYLQPAMTNAEVLEKLNDSRFTDEVSQYNIELNVLPRSLAGTELLSLERELSELFTIADTKARDAGAMLAMIGALPTLQPEHLHSRWLSAGARYDQLNKQIMSARGEDLRLDIEGSALPGQSPERLHWHAESIAAAGSCTSAQLHLQVTPQSFATYWNAAQCLAGPQIAIAANSPFVLGKALWHETRIALYQQATDTRPEELKNQGVRPRAWFGERWITSIFDLFDENVRYFPGLLPVLHEEDPVTEFATGRAPQLAELTLLNGTVWRWNRPVYDVVDNIPHLRVENRVLPAGPTIIDLIANAAFFYGAQRALVLEERPLWTQMSFQAAEENMYASARHGLQAQLYWPGMGWVPPDELILRRLLPMAHQGLQDYGVSEAARERYLGVIEQRCLTQRTGASWQREAVVQLQEQGVGRDAALIGMVNHYLELMRAGEPVHTWPIP